MKSRRRRYYTDYRLQGRLLVALVATQTVLTCAAVGYLHLRFQKVVEDNLYRVHADNGGDLMLSLLVELGFALCMVLAASFAMLLVAHLIWSRYVGAVLGRFRSELRQVQALDLRPLPAQGRVHHGTLDLLERWRRLEHRRFEQVHSLVAVVRAGATDVAPHEPVMRNALRQIREVMAAPPGHGPSDLG